MNKQKEKIENILKIIKTCYFNMEIPEENEQILRQLLENTIKEQNE